MVALRLRSLGRMAVVFSLRPLAGLVLTLYNADLSIISNTDVEPLNATRIRVDSAINLDTKWLEFVMAVNRPTPVISVVNSLRTPR